VLTRALVLLVGLLPSAVSVSGQIYGTLREGKLPLRGVPIQIRCGPNSYPGRSDDSGSYRVFVREQGRCMLYVEVGPRPSELPVFSYENPARYDLDLVPSPGGGYELRRR
jgi:hypothetical protein